MDIDIARLLESAELISEKNSAALYRVTTAGRSMVLKVFSGEDRASEVRAYDLLASCGVPTLPTYGIAPNAILIEDLAASPDWRLARESDVTKAEVGVAVAEWYRGLHSAGDRLASQAGLPGFLNREYDALSPETIAKTCRRLGTGEAPVWRLATEHVDALKRAVRSFPETLTYNDFHWTNLALSRNEPLRAIVFDYHLLGIGPAYCDIRNVTGSLGPAAREAFLQAYGPWDDTIAVIDRPLSALYSLSVAAGLPRLPGWAKPCMAGVTNGGLESSLAKAVSWLRDRRATISPNRFGEAGS